MSSESFCLQMCSSSSATLHFTTEAVDWKIDPKKQLSHLSRRKAELIEDLKAYALCILILFGSPFAGMFYLVFSKIHMYVA
jgi:hypothetical protein